MQRKYYLKCLHRHFPVDFSGRLVVKLTGNKAVLFDDVIKAKQHDEILDEIMKIGSLRDFMNTYEFKLVHDWKSIFYYEYEIDQYSIEDDGIFGCIIRFDPNILYDISHFNNSKHSVLTIYRVEDDSRMGVYFSNLLPKQEVQRHQPAPCDDGDLSLVFDQNIQGRQTEYTKRWKFGFKSLEDLEAWFGKNVDEILEYISIYSVNDKHVIKGRKQVAFNDLNANFEGRYLT